MIRTFMVMVALASSPMVNSPSDFDDSLLLSVAPLPERVEDYTLPDMQARAVLVMDRESGTVMYEKDSSERLPVASIAKIMTALIILEENDLNEVVEIEVDFKDIEGSQMGLLQYENITVKSLLEGLLIRSANDSAKALAYYNAGGIESFAEKMNLRARELGLLNTHFVNPIGYDNPNQYSTARDVAILTKFALRNSVFQNIVKTSSKTVTSVNGKIRHPLQNTNKLLGGYLNVIGVKTGTTDDAGACLVSLVKTENDKEIITVVLNSEYRFQETKSIIENVIKNYSW